VNAPSITTSFPGDLLVFGGACASPVSFTPPAGMSERWDAATSGPFKVATEGASLQLATAGATGVRTATASTSCRSVAIQVAVAPG
jgi:hypothetical protein